MTLMEKGNNDNNNNDDDDNNNNDHNNHFHIASYTGLLVIAIKLKAKENIFKVAMLGAFAKFRKATINFVMSVRPHGTIRLPLEGFS
jgi:hypothetical protein